MKRSSFGFVALGLLGTACSYTVTAEIPAARPGQGVVPYVVATPMRGGEALGYAGDTLATRVSLVRADAEATCFDLLQPLPSNATELTLRLELHAEVDDVDAALYRGEVRECSASRECLPLDSPLRAYAVPPNGDVLTLAQRVCFDRLPAARHSVALSRRGLFAWRYRFVFTDPEG